MTTYLFTGISGTMGRAFIRWALAQDDVRVIGISTDEHKQAAIEKEFPDPRLELWLKDVSNRSHMMWAMRAKPDVVIHAAAVKRVEKCEKNPEYAHGINVDGTRIVCEEAMLADVPKVMFISSDKATEPVTVYGKTKAAAESIAIGQNVYRGHGRTRISVCRYGNVESSQGSVIPLFQAKAAAGEPLPITHMDMTRFSWGIDEAVRFVITSLAMMRGGEVFVPKIPRKRIADVARSVSSNLSVIGLRGIEKLHEAMVSVDEAPVTWELEDRYVILPATGQWWSPPPPAGAVPVPERFCYTSELPEAHEAQPCASLY